MQKHIDKHDGLKEQFENEIKAVESKLDEAKEAVVYCKECAKLFINQAKDELKHAKEIIVMYAQHINFLEREKLHEHPDLLKKYHHFCETHKDMCDEVMDAEYAIGITEKNTY